MIKIYNLLKNKANSLLLIALTLLVIIACSKDEDGWADERYFSNFEFYFDNPNPKTGLSYTEEELEGLKYDPKKEGHFELEQQVVLSFVLSKQISSLHVMDVMNNNALYTFNQAEMDGEKYRVNISTTLTDLNLIEIGDKLALKYNFVYQDGSIGSTVFKLVHAKPPPPPPVASDIPFLVGPFAKHIKGLWKFDDANYLTKALVGNDLELIGEEEAVEGHSNDDGAVLLNSGSGYSIDHGLPASGGDKLNNYSIIYDVNAPAVDTYVNLLQNSPNNSVDGTLYIKPNAGFWLNGLSDSDGDLVQANTWHRIVITLNEGAFKIYIDGALVHTVTGVEADSYFAPELSNFMVFIDDNGEDAAISCSELVLLDKALNGSEIALMGDVSNPTVRNVANDVAGRWKFDDPNNLAKATIGNELELIGSDEAVAGIVDGDGASLLTTGNGYSVDHGMEAVGGDKVNTYSIIYDINAPAVDTYVNILQNSTSNAVDGTLYIKPNAGFWLNGLSDSDGGLVQADTWHRLVITLDQGSFKIYVDGSMVHSVSGVEADSYFAPDVSNFMVFIDDNGEDAAIKCSDLIVLKRALSASEVANFHSVDTPVY